VSRSQGTRSEFRDGLVLKSCDFAAERPRGESPYRYRSLEDLLDDPAPDEKVCRSARPPAPIQAMNDQFWADQCGSRDDDDEGDDWLTGSRLRGLPRKKRPKSDYNNRPSPTEAPVSSPPRGRGGPAWQGGKMSRSLSEQSLNRVEDRKWASPTSFDLDLNNLGGSYIAQSQFDLRPFTSEEHF